MNAISRVAVACLLAAASSAFAQQPAACERDPSARGMAERMSNIQEQMNRIEFTAGNANAQRRLMDLHMKTMHEGLQELRRRGVGAECRMEMMHAMMEQLLRHQLAVQEADD